MALKNHQMTYTNPPELDDAALVAFLATQPDIVATYLFGSLAEGQAHRHSDIDIAILFTDTLDSMTLFYRQLQLMGDLEQFADREVDVVILNTASLLLQFQVLRHGRRLYERNKMARVDYEVQVGKRYADLKPRYDYFNRVMMEEIKEGHFGKRRRRRIRTPDVSTGRVDVFGKRAVAYNRK